MKQKKILILGGSLAQLPAIEKAKALGHKVLVCDYLKDAPGHALADASALVSTFDYEGVLEAARQAGVDGIMTLGTDQPVLTAARVAKALSLPSLISPETALAATDKAVMKRLFKEKGIPTADWVLYEKGEDEAKLSRFKGPVVVKPVDSQGQRGVFYLEDPGLVPAVYDKVAIHSRQNRILVEDYYPHEEVTVSGWVETGICHVLSITDRVTFDEAEKLGICLSHEMPSRHMAARGPEIIALTRRIVEGFGIEGGPIYFQMLVGEEGIKVNEIACRIGGAFEASFLPVATGFDPCACQLSRSLGEPCSLEALKDHDVLSSKACLSVQLFFASACTVARMPSLETVLAQEGVLEAGFNVGPGDRIGPIENATARAGYAIVAAGDRRELEKRVEALYTVLRIEDARGVDHVVRRGPLPPWEV